MGKTYQRLLSLLQDRRAGFLFLIDPDKTSVETIPTTIHQIEKGGSDGILVGGSLLFSNRFDEFIRIVKQETNLPVIIFPGSSRQISAEADAILFLTFVSSRNPNFLIGEQVLAAPIIHSLELETISTGYMHVESGNTTTVEFLSGSRPIPRDKSEIAVAHALAAEYLGMKFVYLEAGSGAKYSPPNDMIMNITEHVNVPLIVGGGIRNPQEAGEKVEAGAKFIVIGNALEKDFRQSEVQLFSDMIHGS